MNNYYNFPVLFSPGQKVRSDGVNVQYQALETAFDLLPTAVLSLALGTTTFGGASTGAGNAYAVTPPDTRTADASGDEIVFVADKTNTGAATLNVDGNGAQSLVRADGVALAANDIQTGLTYTARYDLANTRWQLVGPSASYLTNTSASASAAASSASASSTSAAASLASENAALASEVIAGQWAVHPEDDDLDSAPGQFSALHWAAKAQASAADVTQVSGTGTDLPSAPGTSNANLPWRNFNGIDWATVGFEADTDFTINNLAHGGRVILSGEQTGGALVTLATFDPDGIISLGIAASGNSVNILGLSNPDILDNGSTLNLGTLTGNHMALGPLAIQAKSNTTTAATLSLNSSGGNVRVGPQSGSGAVSLYHGGVEVFTTLATGGELIDSGGDAPEIRLIGTAAALHGQIFANSASLTFKSLRDGVPIILSGEDLGGTPRNVFHGDPDGAATLYYTGTARLATSSSGVDVTGTFLDITEADTAQRYVRTWGSAGGGALVSMGTSGNTEIVQIGTTGGFEHTILRHVRDGATRLSYNGTITLETTVNGAGVLGTLFDLNNSGAATPAQLRARNSEGGWEWRADAGQAVLRQTDSAGNLQDVWIACNSNASVDLNYNGVTSLSTTVNGINLQPAAAAIIQVIASGVNNDASLRLRGAINGGVRLSWDESADQGFLNQTASGGGFENVWINMVRDGRVGLFDNGIEKLRTTPDGIDVLDADSNAILDVITQGTNTDAILGVRGNANGGARFYWDESASIAYLRQTTPGGTIEDIWINMVKNGRVGLFYDATERLSTTANGIDVLGSGLDLNNSGTDAETSLLVRNLIGGTRLLTDNVSGNMSLRQTTSAGTNEDIWLLGTRNAEVSLYYNGVAKLSTTTQGVDITHSSSVIVDLICSSTNLDAIIGLRGNANGGLRMYWDESVSTAFLRQTTAGGAIEDVWMDMVKNAAVGLYFNGTREFITQDSDANYNTSGAQVLDHSQALRDIGWNVMPVIEQDASITLSELHVGKVLHRDVTGAVVYTLPSGTTGAIPPVGSNIMIANENTGSCTVVASGTLRWFAGTGGAAPLTGTRTLARDAVVTVYHYSNTEWWIWGTGIS